MNAIIFCITLVLNKIFLVITLLIDALCTFLIGVKQKRIYCVATIIICKILVMQLTQHMEFGDFVAIMYSSCYLIGILFLLHNSRTRKVSGWLINGHSPQFWNLVLSIQ
jgi:hypothetical protein